MNFMSWFGPGPSEARAVPLFGTTPTRHSLHAVVFSIAVAVVLTIIPRAQGDGNAPAVNGLPFTRSYAFDEIGNESRGARLGFDSLGRIAVMHQGAFVVLNDTNWIDIADKDPDGESPMFYAKDWDGVSYFCGQGSWGTVEYTPEGKRRPHPALPQQYPKWVPITNFTEIVPVESGVCFSGWNGVVYWDRTTNEQVFFEIPQVSQMFAIKGKVFVSSLVAGIQSIDLPSRRRQQVDGPGTDGIVIERVTGLGDGRVLVSTTSRRLLVFDGRRFSAWPNARPAGHIAALEHLLEGGVAVAIEGKGVFILSAQGEVRTALTSPEYQHPTSLVTREAGVLWMATEQGVEKVLYDSPVTVVDQRLGVPITWPQIVRWNDRTVIASDGRLYETVPQRASATAAFRLIADQPTDGAWGIAAQGNHMLSGNMRGVFARESSGAFVPVLTGLNVDRLVMVNPDLCYVIGATEIAALRWADGRWSECAARIPGVGYPALVHAAKTSAWIELGPNRAARVSLSNGRLHTRIFDTFPWTEPRWVNVSVVGDMVVLRGPPRGLVFFDENSETLCAAPRLQQLFDQAPYTIARLREDSDGTLWASHEQGVFKILPDKSGYRFDLATLDIIKDRIPLIQILDGNDVWLYSKQSLYHVNRNGGSEPQGIPVKPILVSVVDGRSRREIFGAMHSTGSIPRLRFAQNSLAFRFFAGGYSSMRSSGYDFRMNGRPILTTDSLLTLPDLREGAYHLDVNLVGTRGPIGDTLAVDFEIEPPWYRTWCARIFNVGVGALAIFGFIAWMLRRTRSRNLALEIIIQQRTEALRTAMHHLEEETRNSATLAERGRLAAEIHDSLQQGLSGLMLQLEATLKLPTVSNDIRSRLSVARNMVSFTRHEVQNAVWNLESPFLESDDLGEALNKMAELISAGGPNIELRISGTPRSLSSSAKHHLLRIAQEAITNAVRHGVANRIEIVLRYTEASVSLAVNDDGRGFLPEQVLTQEPGHFGLRGLRGRTDKINGDIQIISELGHGTSIQITVPTS